jgi:hypothetical protein
MKLAFAAAVVWGVLGVSCLVCLAGVVPRDALPPVVASVIDDLVVYPVSYFPWELRQGRNGGRC